MQSSTSFDNVTKVAAIVPILAAVYFSCRGFIGLGLTAELVVILTALFASVSWMLSQALMRFLHVRGRNKGMAFCVSLLGTAFLAVEASLTHIGLEWLLSEGKLAVPSAAVWFFSIVLSISNVLCKWVFLGDPGEARPQLGTKPRLVRTAPIDPKTGATMEKIAKQMTAS